MAEADFTRKDLQDMFSTMAENLKKDSEESMKTMEENLKSAITTKTNDNYKSLKLDLARNTNIVSTLVEYVSRGKIKNLFGIEFVPQCLVEDIPGLMRFVNKVEPGREEIREKFITSALGLIETNLGDFVSDLLNTRGYTPKSSLLVDGKISDDILDILDGLKDHLASKRSVYRHEIRVVDKLLWYFTNQKNAETSRYLLTSAQGPGLPVFIWTVGKEFRASWFQSDLEFDCEGQIFTSVTKMHPKDKTSCVISCGEIKTTLSQKAKKKSKQQLGIRLNVIKTVLQHSFSIDSFSLKGYTFYMNNGVVIEELQTVTVDPSLEQSMEIFFIPLRSSGRDSFDDDEE